MSDTITVADNHVAVQRPTDDPNGSCTLSRRAFPGSPDREHGVTIRIDPGMSGEQPRAIGRTFAAAIVRDLTGQ